MSDIKKKKFKINNFIWKNILSAFFVLSIFLISARVEAANLLLSPSLGNFYAGDTFKVSVLVDTRGVAINSIESNIDFSTEYLSVVSLSKVGSIFSLWIQEPTYSNIAGRISFTGGLPTPGYNGSKGKIIDITFRVKKTGIAKINYSTSAVRANDGLGTDVLQSGGEGEYTITVKSKEPEVVNVAKNKPFVTLSPEISSPTHSDSEKWYSDRNPKFSWTFPDEFNAIRISYDENPEAIPTLFYATTSSEREFTNVGDGVHYLHLQVRDSNGWSKISNFKFQIDTERPLNFTITELNKEDSTKIQTEFTFNAADELSGLDHFEIKIDESAPEIINGVINQRYKTSSLSSGKHVIFIKAYDKSGNYVSGSTLFYVNLSVISSTKKIILDIDKYTSKIYDDVLLITKGFIGKVGEVVNNPLGSAIIKTISAIGLIVALPLPFLVFLFSSSLSDMRLMFVRFLLGRGLRRKKRSWGTVYDSVTKRPIDLAHVYLIDLETGRYVANYITDANGRYGFIALPGRYGIGTRKSNYVSPSMILNGKISDEVYNNLYFNEEISVTNESEIITKNIPMDSLSLNWNKFVKEKNNATVFIEHKIIREISKISFEFGIAASMIAAIFIPVTYNLAILVVYLFIFGISFIFRGPKFGMLVESHTNIPLSFAIVKIYRAEENMPIIKKVADKFGNYFTQVPNGKYYLTIDKKNNDGSYTELLHTSDIDIKDGLVNFDIKI